MDDTTTDEPMPAQPHGITPATLHVLDALHSLERAVLCAEGWRNVGAEQWRDPAGGSLHHRRGAFELAARDAQWGTPAFPLSGEWEVLVRLVVRAAGWSVVGVEGESVSPRWRGPGLDPESRPVSTTHALGIVERDAARVVVAREGL